MRPQIPPKEPYRIYEVFAGGQPSAELRPAPRRVPFAMIFGELFACPHWFAFGTYVFILGMTGVTPIGFWTEHPEAAVALLVVTAACPRRRLDRWRGV